MTTAIRFSRQNDAGLRASNTQYWENLALVVVLVSESKALYYGRIIIYLGKTTNRKHLFFPSIPALRLLWPGFENEIFQSSLRKQPTFLDATNDGVPAKWRLRSECRASILLTCRYPDLRWASDWLKHISHEARPIKTTARPGWGYVIGMVFLRSFLGRHFEGESRNAGRFCTHILVLQRVFTFWTLLYVFLFSAAADAFKGQVRVINKNYTTSLSDNTSPEYQQLANETCSEVRN